MRSCTYTIAHAYSDKASNAKKSRDASGRAGDVGDEGKRDKGVNGRARVATTNAGASEKPDDWIESAVCE